MVVRKRKRVNKLRGNRTHGGGDKKNRRGAGSRGGRGRAGSHKHKFSKYWMTFGMKRKLKAKKKLESVNLQEIHKFLDEKGVLDGAAKGIGKILGKGELKRKIIVKNVKVSKIAAEKIEAAGGKIQEGGEIEQDEEFDADEEDENEEAEGGK
jgi:large subunit ribosomal protein L15